MTHTAGAERPEKPTAARILRFLELLGAAILVGGLAATAAIAEVAFDSPDVLSRDQAGSLMSRVFEGSIFVEAAAVALIALPALISRRIKVFALAAVLGGAIVGGHVFLAGRMDVLRLAHQGSIRSLPADDPDRVAFIRMHGLYAVLALGLFGTGLAVLAAGTGDRKPE